MATSRRKAMEYGEKLLARPRAEVKVRLRRTKSGVTLLHEGKALTKCYPSPSGIQAAAFVAESLGVKLPALGKTADASVSTGLLWRSLSLSSLDYRIKESYILAERLLEEAETMRGPSALEV